MDGEFVPVAEPPEIQSCQSEKSHSLPGEQGYISSTHISSNGDLTSKPCPWNLKAGKGQNIDVTLLDFREEKDPINTMLYG